MSILIKLMLKIFEESQDLMMVYFWLTCKNSLVAECECFISTGSGRWNNLQTVFAILQPPTASELTSHNLLINFFIRSSLQHNQLHMAASNAPVQ